MAGDAGRSLQVIASVSEKKQREIAAYLQTAPISVIYADTPLLLDIRLTGWGNGHSAAVRIAGTHSNIVLEKRDGESLRKKEDISAAEENQLVEPALTVADIVEFADTVALEDVAELVERQAAYNTAIAEEGLRGNWGANIGSVLLKEHPEDISCEAKAWAAAGSDARMSGCEMPVVILSGSGNQGITASVPVVRYAEHIGASPGETVPRSAGQRLGHDPYQKRNRPALCLLRRSGGGRRCRSGHCVLAGRGL